MNSQGLYLLHCQTQVLRLSSLDRDSPQFGFFIFAPGKKQMVTVRRPHKPRSIRKRRNFRLWQPKDFTRFSTSGWSDPKPPFVATDCYEGQQLVSKEWIEQSTSFQTKSDHGFYWWIHEPDNALLPRAIEASGSGGQSIFIVPEEDLVIVMTSEPYTDAEASLEGAFYHLAQMIINSIIQ